MSETRDFTQLVVIGSSAGGIEALSILVGTLPTDFPAPVVVAQHLDPGRESHLEQILARRSTVPIRTLSNYEELRAGTVYVVPANRDVEITDHDIQLSERSHRSTPSIDRLFSSAAPLFGEHLIAVILTGTGSDGAAGAYEVQRHGGTVVIEDPATASFPALPRSLAPTTVDYVAQIDEIGPLLYSLLTKESTPRGDDITALDELLGQLRERHGVDFRAYKQPTVMRRLRRRLVAAGMPNIAEYMRYLQRNPEEELALVSTFLIKVTQFFRDPDLFATLRERVLPAVIESGRGRNRELRLWSAGCATGEEAYSLGIVLAELLGDELQEFHVRIFATDLDADAITFARQGLYPPSSLAGVPEDILSRYFDLVDGSYQVKKALRAMMVFGQHNLGDRAPFPRVDLVMCRNVLIYFTPELQGRILQLFAFSLRDGGYLILGKSETTSPYPDAYLAEDNRLKIYLRRGDRSVLPTTPMHDISSLGPTRISPARPALFGAALRAQPPTGSAHVPGTRSEDILRDLSLGVVVIDRNYDIQYINEAGRTLLGIHTSALGEDLIHLVQSTPPTELRALVDRTLKSHEPNSAVLRAAERGIGTVQYLEIACRLQDAASAAPDTVTVTVADVTEYENRREQRDEASMQAQQELERVRKRMDEISDVNRELLSANQQLTREIVELRGQNEEFLVGNEELQAATEEVETLNEELQATNEELETLNEELQATVEELNTTNDDLETRNAEIQDLAIRLESERSGVSAVLNSMGAAIVVMSRSGEKLLTNGEYDRLFSGAVAGSRMLEADGSEIPADSTPEACAARGEVFRMRFLVPSGDLPSPVFEAVGQPLGGVAGGGVLVIREIQPVEPTN